MVDLLGNGDGNGIGSGIFLPSFDFNVLANYYASGASISESVRVAFIRRQLGSELDPSDIVPPWLQSATSTALDNEIISRLFDSSATINFDDPAVLRAGAEESEDFTKLFALYVGLLRMRELADFATNDARAQTLLPLLDRRFQQHLGEVEDFVRNLSVDDITLLFGDEQSTLKSSLRLAIDPNRAFSHFGSETSTVRDDAIAAITGTETFEIKIDVDGIATHIIAIDLSNVSGTLNEDNIVDYINGELEAVAVGTRFATVRYDENSYGFEIKVGGSETVTLSDTTGAEDAALYIAGTQGSGDFAGAFIAKYDDLSAPDPVEVFRNTIQDEAGDRIIAAAVDSEGNFYTVGTTSGNPGELINVAEDQDVVLRKFNGAGQLLFERLLGAETEASVSALAIDGDDNVIIAGTTPDLLAVDAFGGGYDTFVTKYDSNGVEIFTRQAAPFANDGALALTTDASGNIFVAGHTRGPVSSAATYGGGLDGYVTKISADGTVEYSKQFGDSGDDQASAVAVDGSGNFYLAGEKDGKVVLRKYADSAASQTPVWELELGDLQDNGAVTGLAIGSGGEIYLSGYSSNAALTGTVAQAHSGGLDGFVVKVTDSGASASADFVSYLGTTDTDRLRDIVVDTSGANDRVFVTGDTDGDLGGGGAPASSEAFFLELDDAGATQNTVQFGDDFNLIGRAIDFDATGSNILFRLGLPTGTLQAVEAIEVASLTSARAGQSIKLVVDGDGGHFVSIDADDSFGMLIFHLNQALGDAGRARMGGFGNERFLEIEAFAGHRIEVLSGIAGFDMLAQLGLQEVVLIGPETLEDEEKSSVFGMGLRDDLNLADAEEANEALILLDFALLKIRRAYDFLTGAGDSSSRLPAMSAADAERIANLKTTLATVTSLVQAFQNNLAALIDTDA